MTAIQAHAYPTGTLALKVRRGPSRPRESAFRWHLRNWVENRWREVPFYVTLAFLLALKKVVPALTVVHSSTALKKTDGLTGEVTDYGVVGRHLVVTAGKNYIAGMLDGTNTANLFKFHGFGSGTTAASAGDTALQTEYTTQYATDNTRPTGSQAHSSNTYTTVGTFSPDSGGTLAVTEWGLFTQAANSGGTMLDHQVFSAVNLVAANGDSLQATYVFTIS